MIEFQLPPPPKLSEEKRQQLKERIKELERQEQERLLRENAR